MRCIHIFVLNFLVWSGQTERGSSESKAYYNFIRSNWKARGFSEQDDHMSFDDFWNWSVHNGYTNEPILSSSLTETDIIQNFDLNFDLYARMTFLILLVYVKN